MADKKTIEKTITVKELAEKAGIEPTHLRRILRTRFPRADKGKPYEWKPGDKQIALILEAVKSNGHKATTKITATKKTTTERTQPKVVKPKAETKVTPESIKAATDKVNKIAETEAMVATMEKPKLHKPTGNEPGAVK
jgi:hypothetical protein